MARNSPRRYLFYAVILLTLVLLLRYTFRPLPFGPVSYDLFRPHQGYEKPPKANDGRFQWTDVPTKYPPASIAPLPAGRPRRLPRIQHAFARQSEAQTRRRRARQKTIKDTFIRCWQSYKDKAWMKDELAPLSGGFRNTFGGWAATLVDSLDTLHMMGLLDEFNHAVSAIGSIDFSRSDESTLNIFETTIRYLGGFLSAYDLSGQRVLLDKAVELGEMLYVAFDTPNRMPVTRWDWKAAAEGQSQQAGSNTLVSEIGSLTLEFTRLSQLTNDPKWFDAVQRISDAFLEQQNRTKLPGMWPVVVNAETKDFAGDSGFTLGGMADSLYEYLPKEYALLGGRSPMYRELYLGSMKTAIDYHFFRPMVPDNADILLSGDVRANAPGEASLEAKGQHLACFTAGMLGLGSRLFDLPSHLPIARKLIDGCVYTYNALPLGIMPEVFHMAPCASSQSCTWDETAWHSAIKARVPADDFRSAAEIISANHLPPGFTSIEDRRYILRPEALESIFILYRITGDESLQDTAWKMFETIDKYTKTDFANAALDDITALPTDERPLQRSDRMESFWLAETLKYLYLLFSEPELISLDEYVLNTEAHPFKRPR